MQHPLVAWAGWFVAVPLSWQQKHPDCCAHTHTRTLRSSSKHKTFKPVKAHSSQQKTKLSEYAKATLGSGDMRVAVRLPQGEDLNEWLAVNTVDFFNEISLLYGTITEFCTKASCSVMSAGPQYEYLWADGVKVKKPIKVSAPEYVDLLMSWVEAQLNDEQIFPLQLGTLHALVRSTSTVRTSTY